MKRAVSVFLFLIWFGVQALKICAAAELPQEAETETEDYRLLRDIIHTEFSGQVPHEWGESVSGVKTRLKTNEKVVALGVDVCDLMGKGQDARLIKFFAAENISATLFFCGDWIDKNGAVLKKLAANTLFEIANEGVSRKACSVNGKTVNGVAGAANVDELFQEIEKNARKIDAMTGALPQYYHAVSGYYDEVAVRVIRALGYEALGSSGRGPQPDQNLKKRDVLDMLVNPAAGTIAILGGVSLQSSFVDGAIEAVRKLRSQGYQFVKVSNYSLE